MIKKIIEAISNGLGFAEQKQKNLIAQEVIDRKNYLEAYYHYTQNEVSKLSDKLEGDINMLDGQTMPKNTKDLLKRKLESRNKVLEKILRK